MIHTVTHFVRWALDNYVILGTLCFMLISVPTLGMWTVHKYRWEHWEPFVKNKHN